MVWYIPTLQVPQELSHQRSYNFTGEPEAKLFIFFTQENRLHAKALVKINSGNSRLEILHNLKDGPSRCKILDGHEAYHSICSYSAYVTSMKYALFCF